MLFNGFSTPLETSFSCYEKEGKKERKKEVSAGEGGKLKTDNFNDGKID